MNEFLFANLFGKRKERKQKSQLKMEHNEILRFFFVYFWTRKTQKCFEGAKATKSLNVRPVVAGDLFEKPSFLVCLMFVLA